MANGGRVSRLDRLLLVAVLAAGRADGDFKGVIDRERATRTDGALGAAVGRVALRADGDVERVIDGDRDVTEMPAGASGSAGRGLADADVDLGDEGMAQVVGSRT